MTGVRRKVEEAGNELETIAANLESGTRVDAEPSSVIAAIALAGSGRDLGPFLRQGSPVRSRLSGAASEASLSKLFPRAKRPNLLALSAGLLQILDEWHASHEAAQLADDLGETEFSAYWHAIAHRREPDPGNAGYWFRRVGRHAAFEPISQSVRAILETSTDSRLENALTPNGLWDPMAFVRFSGEAARKPGSSDEALARRIQRAEMLILLDLTCEAL